MMTLLRSRLGLGLLLSAAIRERDGALYLQCDLEVYVAAGEPSPIVRISTATDTKI